VTTFAVLVEYELPDDTDLGDALRPLLDAIRTLSPTPPSNTTAYNGDSADALIDAAHPDAEWGYSFVDSPTAVCGPVSELTARRQVDGDFSAELQRRDLDGPWVKVETR
jgi:hypothetical protein